MLCRLPSDSDHYVYVYGSPPQMMTSVAWSVEEEYMEQLVILMNLYWWRFDIWIGLTVGIPPDRYFKSSLDYERAACRRPITRITVHCFKTACACIRERSLQHNHCGRKPTLGQSLCHWPWHPTHLGPEHNFWLFGRAYSHYLSLTTLPIATDWIE